MQSLTQPTLLLKPFADSGDKNTIPVTNSDVANPQLADLTNGFPAITSEDPDDGGLPPERKDFNGLGYLTTTYDFFYQAGGTFTYNATIASAIGGYPLGARLWYTDSSGKSTVLRSTKANNTDNFNTTPSYIGTSWVVDIPVLSWNNTWTGNNTFSGSVTCSDSVSLGSSATATTQTASDNSTKLATTAWVRSSGNGVVHTSGNETIAGNKTFSGSSIFSGSVTCSSSIALGSSATAITQASSDNSGKVATTAFVKIVDGAAVHIAGTETITGNKTFSGSVALGSSATATTQANSNNSTRVATTAYVKNILAALYPVGSLYIGTQNSCPLATLISGSTWTLVAQDKALWGGNGSNGNTTIAAGLPNITGKFGGINATISGAFAAESGSKPCDTSTSIYDGRQFTFDASKSNSIYGNSSTVQPPAYRVNVWRRTA